MGWFIFLLTIVYLVYRALSSASKPQPIPSFALPVPSFPRHEPFRANFEAEVNDLINGMSCSRCNTGEAPTYKKNHGSETINCCCQPFLKEITARIEAHFSTDRVTCAMTYHGENTDSTAPLVRERGQSPSMHRKRDAEPEILIRYVDADGQETTRKLSNLRYSTSYYFKAYCHLREDERHFCPERIKQAVDLRTGELLDTITVKWGDKGKTRKITDIGWE